MDVPTRSPTSGSWRTRSPLVLLLIVVLYFGFSLSDRHVTPVTSNTSPVSYTFECCRAPVVNTVYRPGEVLRLQWVRVAQAPGPAGPTPRAMLTLRASLSGPFSNVATLKTASVSSSSQLGSIGITAVPLKVSNRLPSGPVSLIRIPSTARSGYFNLSFRVSSGAWSVSSATIIRVTS
jgi:hypothetical protein